MAQDIILWSLVTVDLPLSLSLFVPLVMLFWKVSKQPKSLCSDGPSNYLPIFHTFLCASFVFKQCAPSPPAPCYFKLTSICYFRLCNCWWIVKLAMLEASAHSKYGNVQKYSFLDVHTTATGGSCYCWQKQNPLQTNTHITHSLPSSPSATYLSCAFSWVGITSPPPSPSRSWLCLFRQALIKSRNLVSQGFSVLI